jgi:hypothetical protein
MRKPDTRNARTYLHGREPHMALDYLLKDSVQREWLVSGNRTSEHESAAKFCRARDAPALEDQFGEGWTSFLVAEARKRFADEHSFSIQDAMNLAGAAYSVFEAAVYVQSLMDNRYSEFGDGVIVPIEANFPPAVLPSSRFKEDLDFDTGCFRIIHGIMPHKPMEKKAGVLGKLMLALRGESPDGFYDQKTASDMARYVFDDMKFFEQRKREKGF